MMLALERTSINLLQHEYWQQFPAFAINQLRYEAPWYMFNKQLDSLCFEFAVQQLPEGIKLELRVNNFPDGMQLYESRLLELLASLLQRHSSSSGNPVCELRDTQRVSFSIMLDYSVESES